MQCHNIHSFRVREMFLIRWPALYIENCVRSLSVGRIRRVIPVDNFLKALCAAVRRSDGTQLQDWIGPPTAPTDSKRQLPKSMILLGVPRSNVCNSLNAKVHE